MNFTHARQDFYIADIKLVARTHGAQHGLPCSGRTVDLKPHADKALNYLLDLFFCGSFLHGYDHDF